MIPATHYSGRVAREYEAQRSGQWEWTAEHDAVARWLDGAPRGSTVLDAPVGTGRFLELYAERGLRCLGVDCSADMLAIAAAKNTGAAFLRADLRDSPFIPFSARAVCVRLANWLTPPELSSVLRLLSSRTREIVLGIATSPVCSVEVGGARTHVERMVLEDLETAQLSVERRDPVTLAREYTYAIWYLQRRDDVAG